MAFLEPIDEAIQLKLFQKMRILSREGNSPNTTVNVDGLSLDKMATRSTFIRMTSGLDEPVVLMGGELVETADENFNIVRNTAGGYDEIYGQRPYITYDLKIKGQNKFRRPMPGIKSLDAQFLGGNKALREATINWTCWSFEDIDRLTPHFLSVGKTVCVEWGWVYGNNGLRNVRGFIGSNGIRKSAYENHRGVINRAKGDIDMVVGIVKNFEFTTRSDGGFDCTTTITSVGTDFIKKVTPAKGSTNMTVRIGAKKGESAEDLKKKLESDNTDKNESDVTLKNVVAEIDSFCVDQVLNKDSKRKKYSDELPESKTSNLFDRGYIFKRNSFIIEKGAGFVPKNVWIRWGWFEDNILSKFETVIGGNDIIKSQIRSVDIEFDSKKENIIGFKPTLIRDDEYFETVNISKYILPGKLFPISKNDFINDGVDKNFVKDFGDEDEIQNLASFVNESSNFKAFNAQTEADRADRGIFRNMLINTKLLREAFGVSEGIGVESLSTFESLERMLNLLNEDIGFWDFQLQSDETQTYRIKIVDGNNIEKKLPEKTARTIVNDKLTRSAYDSGNNTLLNQGVFYFPVWQHDSLVKDQNVNCTIPNEIAISVMYGANAPKINTLGATENEANDEGAQAAGGAGRSNGDGGDLKDLSIVYHKTGYEKYGVDPMDDEFGEYSVDNRGRALRPRGDNLQTSIKDYFTNDKVKERVDKRKKDLQKEKDKEIQAASAARTNTFLDKDINSALPPPLPRHLTVDERKSLFANVQIGDKKLPETFNNVKAKEFAELYGKKFDDERRMKQEFIDSIVYNTTYPTRKTRRTQTSELDKPLLLPISLELSIDGIGGIMPFQSFHSTYLPKRYQDEALFQIFSVNHTIDSSQWTTTIGGKMRSNLRKIYKEEIVENDILEVSDQFVKAQRAANAQELKKSIDKKVEETRKKGVPTLQEAIDAVTKIFEDEEKAKKAENE